MRLLACLKFDRRTPHRSIYLRVGRYVVKVAETPDEFYQLFRLRYRVFHGTLRSALLPFALDSTPYEEGADHLIVKDGHRVVGTYRLRCSKYCTGFFSSSEFDIEDFLRRSKGRVLLELGRACIDPKHRAGPVLISLLKGIITYALAVKADYLFGCTSVFTTQAEAAAGILRHLYNRDAISQDFHVKPLPSFRVQGLKTVTPMADISKVLPPLLASYLKMGTKVAGEPAFDPTLRCFDFFTVLTLKEMDPQYLRKLS